MSGEHKDGGPAFPFHYDAGGPYPNYVSGKGMTLRDYFAGKALIGIVMVDKNNHDAKDQSFEVDATLAYRYADAMLKARQS